MINKDFKSILDLLKEFSDEQICIDHLTKLRWNGDVVSPFDHTSKVYVCNGNKYRCKNTGKYFNVRTETMFDNTKIPLQKWFLAIWIITSHKKGISSVQLSKDIDITQKSAWFMLQRIRNCFGIENNNDLNNVDEASIGDKNKNHHSDKKVVNSQGHSLKDKTPVFGMGERIAQVIKETATMYTDKYLRYNSLKRIYDHAFVKHNSHVNSRIHTNTTEGFWSLLKRGIIGIYNLKSSTHLKMYVDEFRYNTTEYTESNRFNLLLTNSTFRLTYKQLIK